MKHQPQNDFAPVAQLGANYIRDQIVPFKSCVTNLMESLEIITSALNNDRFVDVVSTVFSKAFDRVNHNLLIQKLGANGYMQRQMS